MSELTSKDLHWFRLANSNPPSGFYDFKSRFLRRFGSVEGFDLQHVPRTCHACDGCGEYLKGVPCDRCDGSGIYDVRDHWLQRWRLGDSIYHKPMDHADVYHLFGFQYPEPVMEFQGLIRHEQVDARVANRSYLRLLIRHEPIMFYAHVIGLIQRRGKAVRTKWFFCLIRLRNKLDLFPAVPEDDVPF